MACFNRFAIPCLVVAAFTQKTAANQVESASNCSKLLFDRSQRSGLTCPEVESSDDAALLQTNLYNLTKTDQARATLLSLTSSIRTSKRAHNVWPICIAVYMIIHALCIIRLMWTVFFPPRNSQELALQAAKGRPEEECWKRSFLSWISLDWVSTWMSHWGASPNDSHIYTEASSLGKPGSKDDEAWNTGVCMEKLWNSEEQRRSDPAKSLLKTIIHFVTYKKLYFLLFCSMCHSFLLYLGPPFGIRLILTRLKKIHLMYASDPTSVPVDLKVWTSIEVIGFFSIGMTLTCCSDALTFMIATRMSIRVRSALLNMVYRKAQRVRQGGSEFDLPSDGSGVQQRYSFMALVNTDINANVPHFFVHFFHLVPNLLVVVVMLFMLTSMLGSSLLYPMILIASLIIFVLWCSSRQTNTMRVVGSFTAERVKTTQEMLHYIRVIKAYAWELAVLGKLTSWRGKELEHLRQSYRWMGIGFALAFNFGRMLILASVASFAWINGDIDVVVIFTIMQMLSCFAGAAGSAIGAVPTVLAMMPSCVRIATFLNLSEEKTRPCIVQRAQETTSGMIGMCTPPNLSPRSILKTKADSCVATSKRSPNATDVFEARCIGTGIVSNNHTDGAASVFLTGGGTMAGDTGGTDPQATYLDERSVNAPPPSPHSGRGVHETFGVKSGIDLDVKSQALREAKAKRVPSKSTADLLPWAQPWKDPLGRIPKARLQGSWSWNVSSAPVLRDLDFEIYAGELVAVVGNVGSGKTSLLNALLGELVPKDHHCLRQTPTVIAHHSQNPLIYEGTLRDNVIFWRGDDTERLNAVLDASALRNDLIYLPGAEAAGIGTHGISLSAGQRSRVSLARVAYSKTIEVLLFDDPFSAVDNHTADHICKNLLCGTLLQDKARVVVCEPDLARLEHFDRVVIMEEGKIVAQASPSDVASVPNFQSLLLPRDDVWSATHAACGKCAVQLSNKEATDAALKQQIQLQDEHCQGRAEWRTISFFFELGRWHNLLLMFFFFGGFFVLNTMFDVVLARWGTAALLGYHNPGIFIRSALCWAAFSLTCYLFQWLFLMRFTFSISTTIHSLLLDRLLHAPIDGFFDRNPVGRIMSRMTSDLSSLDVQMAVRLSAIMGLFYGLFVPILFVHIHLPWWYALVCLPCYLALFAMIRRYWNLLIVLRHLSAVAKSSLNTYVDLVSKNAATLRAFGVGDGIIQDLVKVIDDTNKTDFATAVSKKWLLFRIVFMFGWIIACVALFGIWNPGNINVGTASLCVSYAILVLLKAEADLDHATAVQTECITMNRVYGYMQMPQERAHYLDGDFKYSNWAVRIPRSSFGSLQLQKSDDKVQIVRSHAANMRASILLRESWDGKALIPVPGVAWEDLAIGTECSLMAVRSLHRLVGVDGIGDEASAIAEELCHGSSREVMLRIESDWLAGGAKITIDNLVTGYWTIPANILNGVSLTIEPRTQVALIGAAGCGKSTLLLSLLRLIEPRAGQIYINGQDTQDLGLHVLRKNFGFVPQDPVLFSGSIRENLDPFEEYTEAEIWKALNAVDLEGTLRKLASQSRTVKGGSALAFRAREDDLNFGQRHLLCVARMILRQPPVLLMDECTSAMDPHTQQLVQNAFRLSFPRSTSIAVAHRLETVLDMDRVVLMDRGTIVNTTEPGNFKDVGELEAWVHVCRTSERTN